jgi:hypothetical protein
MRHFENIGVQRHPYRASDWRMIRLNVRPNAAQVKAQPRSRGRRLTQAVMAVLLLPVPMSSARMARCRDSRNVTPVRWWEEDVGVRHADAAGRRSQHVGGWWDRTTEFRHGFCWFLLELPALARVRLVTLGHGCLHNTPPASAGPLRLLECRALLTGRPSGSGNG